MHKRFVFIRKSENECFGLSLLINKLLEENLLKTAVSCIIGLQECVQKYQ